MNTAATARPAAKAKRGAPKGSYWRTGHDSCDVVATARAVAGKDMGIKALRPGGAVFSDGYGDGWDRFGPQHSPTGDLPTLAEYPTREGEGPAGPIVAYDGARALKLHEFHIEKSRFLAGL